VTENLLSLAEWGVASLPIERETVSGDAHVLVPTSNGFLAAVVDGLGHGPEAAKAARRVTVSLSNHADDTVTDLMRRCHQDLRGTRGAVLSLASFATNHGTLTWLGVGNVEGNLFRAPPTAPPRVPLLLRGGVVGYELLPLREVILPIFFGDVLVLVTDGISSGSSARSPIGCRPQDYADEVLSRWRKTHDDALVLAVRYIGGPPSAA
jgi:phosphoserine phosphatase RsbX